MQPTPEPNPDALREAAGAAATPDPVTADLLAKHSAGEKLTARDYGRLGAFAKKVRGIFSGKGGPEPGSPQPGPAATGHAAPVAAVASVEASPDRLAPVPVDAGVARRVTAALLARGDAACVNYVERNAVRAGATGERLDRFRAAARLAADDRAVIVDLSPDVFAELGIDPRKSPLFSVGAILGLHALNLWQCVDELKELAKDREPRPAPKPSTTPGVPGPGVIVTDPVTPPGAPPLVTAGGNAS